MTKVEGIAYRVATLLAPAFEVDEEERRELIGALQAGILTGLYAFEIQHKLHKYGALGDIEMRLEVIV